MEGKQYKEKKEGKNECVQAEMAKAAKKSEKAKKPAQAEAGGRTEDSTVKDTERREDTSNDRMVVLTDSDGLDT